MRKVLSILALSLGMLAGSAQADQATVTALRAAGVQLPGVLFEVVEQASWGPNGLASILAVLADWGMLDKGLAEQLCAAQGQSELDSFNAVLAALNTPTAPAPEASPQ